MVSLGLRERLRAFALEFPEVIGELVWPDSMHRLKTKPFTTKSPSLRGVMWSVTYSNEHITITAYRRKGERGRGL